MAGINVLFRGILVYSFFYKNLPKLRAVVFYGILKDRNSVNEFLHSQGRPDLTGENNTNQPASSDNYRDLQVFSCLKSSTQRRAAKS